MYDTFIAPFAEFDFMQRALVGVVAIALGSGPVGIFLMLRRMSLTGDAIAHAILPGAALGYLVAGLSLPAMTLGGLVAGIAATLGVRSADAAICRAGGVTCTQNAHCCSGICGPKDARGRRTCACNADLDNDPLNCGACGNVCPSGEGGPNGNVQPTRCKEDTPLYSVYYSKSA